MTGQLQINDSRVAGQPLLCQSLSYKHLTEKKKCDLNVRKKRFWWKIVMKIEIHEKDKEIECWKGLEFDKEKDKDEIKDVNSKNNFILIMCPTMNPKIMK